MPDGDFIHVKLTGKFLTIYKEACEEHFDEEELAYQALAAVKEELKKQGEAVIPLIEKIAVRCDEIVVELVMGSEINWDKEILLIEKQAQRIFAKKTAKDLAVAAGKEIFRDIQHGARDLNFPVEVMRNYMLNLYLSKFEAKVLLAKEHHNGVDEAYVRARLEGMREHVWANLLPFARQASNRHNFSSLRRQSRQRQDFSAENLDVVLAN